MCHDDPDPLVDKNDDPDQRIFNKKIERLEYRVISLKISTHMLLEQRT